ncbi:SIR2 family protein [Mycoplasmatota bacterium zrk1]
MGDNIKKLMSTIRSGKTIFFLGTGFSIPAGFPGVDKTIDIIKDRFSVTGEYNLSTISEYVLDNYGKEGKDKLAKIFLELFGTGNKLDNLNIYKKLRGVPYINQIVTTNYDSLLETIYESSCNIISKAEDLIYCNLHKINIFKIHGTYDDFSSIVLTESDYMNFYDPNFKPYLMNKVRTLFAENSVIFLGFGFNDQYLEKFFKDFGSNSGNSNFYISKSIQDNKLAKIQKYNIIPIEMDTLNFISILEYVSKQNTLTEITSFGGLNTIRTVNMLDKVHRLSTKVNTTSHGITQRTKIKQLVEGDIEKLDLTVKNIDFRINNKDLLVVPRKYEHNGIVIIDNIDLVLRIATVNGIKGKLYFNDEYIDVSLSGGKYGQYRLEMFYTDQLQLFIIVDENDRIYDVKRYRNNPSKTTDNAFKILETVLARKIIPGLTKCFFLSPTYSVDFISGETF